jgi:hypothetical protein
MRVKLGNSKQIHLECKARRMSGRNPQLSLTESQSVRLESDDWGHPALIPTQWRNPLYALPHWGSLAPCPSSICQKFLFGICNHNVSTQVEPILGSHKRSCVCLTYDNTLYACMEWTCSHLWLPRGLYAGHDPGCMHNATLTICRGSQIR